MISRKLLPILLVCLVPLVFGCSAVKTATIVSSVNATVVLTGTDLLFGEMVTATMTYDKEDLQIKERVMGKALEGTDYDIILLPKFKIEEPVVGDDKITVTGRGAKIKNK